MSDLSTDMLTSSTFSRFLDEEGLETLANRIDQVFARKGEGGSKLEYAIYEDSPTLYPHDVNDLIKYNGIYYKVKVAMPEAGVALVVGTNIELANLPAGTGVFLDKIPGSGGGGGGGDASVVKVRYEVSPTENEHALNELIYFNGKVYKCTVAMSDPGVTLVVGTNIELPSLSSTTIVMADGLPGTGMDAADVSYGDSDVDTALTELNSKIRLHINELTNIDTAWTAVLTLNSAPRAGYYLISASIADTDNNIVGSISCSNFGVVASLPDYNTPPQPGWETMGRNMSAVIYLEAGASCTIIFARYGGAVQKNVTASIVEL